MPCSNGGSGGSSLAMPGAPKLTAEAAGAGKTLPGGQALGTAEDSATLFVGVTGAGRRFPDDVAGAASRPPSGALATPARRQPPLIPLASATPIHSQRLTHACTAAAYRIATHERRQASTRPGARNSRANRRLGALRTVDVPPSRAP